MRSKITVALAVCLATLGLAAGLFAFPARADNTAGAKTLDDLWAMGYVLGLLINADHQTNPLGCGVIYVMSGGGITFPDGQEPVIEIAPDTNKPGCHTPDAEIQANIDALVAAYPPLPQPTTTAPDPVPATTTTTAPAPVDVPPAAAPTTAPTQTATVADPTLQAQIDALNAKIDALTGRVDKLATATAAAWDAFVAATSAGASAADAALAARSAALNSLYGL